MLDVFEVHFGYKVVVSIAHQGTNPRISSLFVGPYITRLVKGMGILEGIGKMRMVGAVASISLETPRSMGALQHVYTAQRIECHIC